jgi:hypothetical protein
VTEKQSFLELRHDGQARAVPVGDQRVVIAAGGTVQPWPAGTAQPGRGAIIELDYRGWWVRDGGSDSGTCVNGQPVADARLLQPGDHITASGSEAIFRLRSPAGSPFSPAGSPPPSAAGSPAAGAGTRKHRSKASLSGVARSVQSVQGAQGAIAKLTFRLERYDPSGNRQAPAAVELLLPRRGLINDGEEILVEGRWHHGTFRARTIQNLTTGSEVSNRRGAVAAGCGIVLAVFVVLWVAGIFGFVIFQFARHFLFKS